MLRFALNRRWREQHPIVARAGGLDGGGYSWLGVACLFKYRWVMRKLALSGESAEFGLFKSVLDEAGIRSEIRNENTFSNLPGACFYPELWILDDADYERAADLLRVAQERPRTVGNWQCTACGEESEPQFGSCWKCGTPRSYEVS